MRILLIHQYYKESDVTGGARFNEMTRMWKDRGHDITVIAGDLENQTSTKRNDYKGNFVTEKNQDGITVWRCNVSESYNSGFFGRLWGYFSFVISGTYAGMFKIKGSYDIIIVTSPPLFVGIIAYFVSLVKKAPIVFEVRDLWPESAIDTGMLKNGLIIKFAYWFEKFIYKKAALINVLTKAFKDKLIKEKGVPESKIIMIPNAADFAMSDELFAGFDPEKFRKENGWDGHFVITYVGAHGIANGLHQIIETAKNITDTNVMFVLVGDGMKKKELQAMAEKEKLTNVKFYGIQPKLDALKYVLASDMGTSVLLKNDTFKTVYSNKTFDYMSCKKPILMVIDGVSRELVEEAEAGLYVEPENPADFEQKIRWCLKNQELLKQKGENGYRYAKENFDREVLAYKYLESLIKIGKNGSK